MNYLQNWRRQSAGGQPTPSSEAQQQPPPHFASSSPTGVAHSLELVRYDASTGRFEVGQEALAVLRRTRGPVGVVAVAGRARQGKSYVLNQLLGKSGGFQVGPTHRPCTKGLWMWSAPVERTAPDGSKYSLVLLDTEGIDAYDQTGQYSTQIFSLAVLLSSLFVYNQMGGIDEAALDRLSLVTEMTKHIRVRASDGDATNPAELAEFTPSFIWLLRDFYLRLEEDGRKVTPRDYLESALQTLPGAASAVQAKNHIRESIKALFPNRDCFTLVRPVNDEEALARLDTIPAGQLRPEFREGMAAFTRLTFQKATPKLLGQQVVTGPALAALTEAYVSAINNGAVPTITTAWQGVAEAESRRAADAAEAAYVAAFPADLLPAEEAALAAAHAEAMAEGHRAFEAVALGDAAVKAANERRWKEAVTHRFKELKEKKLATAELACTRAINEATAALAALARREGATLQDLQREAEKFKARYSASAECSGPSKWRLLAQFMQETYGAAQRDLADRQATAQAERQRAATAEATIARQAAESNKVALQQAAARATAAEGSAVALQARISDLERQLRQAQSELARERVAAEAARAQAAQLAQSAQGWDGEVASLVEQVRAARAAEAEAAARATAGVQQVRDARNALEAERARLQSTVEALAAARDAAQQRCSVLEAESARLHSQLAGDHGAAEQHRAALEADVARLQAQLATANVTIQQQQAAATAAATAAAATALPPAVPSPPAGPTPIDEDETFEDAHPVPSPAGPVALPDTKKMTVNAMKEWLTENGHEAAVWRMSQEKAKKGDWEKFIRNLGGR